MKLALQIIIIAVLSAILLVLLTGFSQAANLVVNSGFEVPVNSNNHYPNNYGYWNYDPVITLGSSDGITPYTGSSMLKFLAAYYQPGSAAGCDLYQLVNISSCQWLIESGNAKARITAYFNRVQGDTETDSEFAVQIRAYAGSPDTFYAQRHEYLALIRTLLFSDTDINTWEPLTAELAIPPGTDFLAIGIAAVENIYNDTTGIEFDGHYADDVYLELFTETVTLKLLSNKTDVCHLSWLPADEYSLEFAFTPDFTSPDAEIDIDARVTELYFYTGPVEKGFFRLIPR